MKIFLLHYDEYDFYDNYFDHIYTMAFKDYESALEYYKSERDNIIANWLSISGDESLEEFEQCNYLDDEENFLKIEMDDHGYSELWIQETDLLEFI